MASLSSPKGTRCYVFYFFIVWLLPEGHSGIDTAVFSQRCRETHPTAHHDTTATTTQLRYGYTTTGKPSVHDEPDFYVG